MSRITSKLQVTIPKSIADRFRIQPGDEIDWSAGGELIHIHPHPHPRDSRSASRSLSKRLRHFDEATKRQVGRQEKTGDHDRPKDRGWTREDLYDHVGPR